MQMIGRIGKAPEKLVYRGFRVERKGFLSILSYAIDGHGRRLEMLERGHAAVVLPVDFRTRELYLLAEIRAHKPFGLFESGRAWIRKVMRDGFTKPDETFVIDAADARIFEVCAGMIDADPATGAPLESAAAAASRELREETGLVVAEDRMLPVATYLPSVGGSCETVHAFFADLPEGHLEARVPPKGDGNEEIDVYRMSWDEAFGLLKDGRIVTASTGLMLRELKIIDLEGRK